MPENKRFTYLALIFLAIFIAGYSFGQNRAEKLYDQGRYAESVKAYERYIKRNENDAIALERLGNAYRFMGKYKQAELNYERAEFISGLSDPGFVNYGQVLIKNGKNDLARQQFDRYLKTNPESFVVRLMSQSLNEIESWSLAPKSYTVNAIRGINSKFAEFSPAIYKNGIAFTTERGIDHVNENNSPQNALPYLAVYYAGLEDSTGLNFEKPKPFLSRLTDDFHIGPLSVDTVHEKVYFSRIGTHSSKQVPQVKIYTADIIKNKRLTKPIELPFGSEEYSVMHPAITPDGNTIFFASNENDSLSGLDLYMATRTEGGWSKPVKLKGEVNTELNEVFPFAVSATHIFFASDGHIGYGGLDIFESTLVDGMWTKPTNLKSPINSEFDDFGICFRNAQQGYFSSERANGLGRDDIYQFVQIAEPDDSSRMEVAGIFEYGQLPPEGVMLRLLDENDNILEEVTTDSLGNFYFTELPPNHEYRVEIPNVPKEMLDSSRVYLVNENGEKVLLLDRISNSEFAFKTLEPEVFAGLSLIEEEDKDMGTFQIFGQLYSQLGRDFSEGLALELVDDNGNLLQEVLTDSVGLFAFEPVTKSNYYRVRYGGKDSIIYKSSVYYEDKNGITPLLDSANSLFALERLRIARSITSQLQAQATGYVEYEGRRIQNIRLLMIDSNDQQLRATRSGQAGMFSFGPIPSQQEFKIILPDSVAQLPGKINVYLVNDEGERVVYAKERNARTFEFVSLNPDEFVTTMVSIDETTLEKYGLNGQVFKTLPGDYEDGLTILAIDENGRIIETAIADGKGIFNFTKLQADQHYSFKVAETDGSNLNVDIFDINGELVAHLRLEELSNYFYEMLQSDDAERFKLEEVDEAQLHDNVVAGMIYKQLPGDYENGIMVYAVDEFGNIIDSSMTDGNGHFEFKNLARESEFSLQVMDEDDSGMQLAFFDYNGKLDGYALLDSNNMYTYSKLVLEAASELGMDEIDESNYVYGEAFHQTPGDIPAGTRLYALDADGRIVEVTTLDKTGKFRFVQLQKQGSYFFRLDSEEAATIRLLDEDGNLLQMPDKAGEIWVFDQLAHEKYSLATMDHDDSEFDSNLFQSDSENVVDTDTTTALEDVKTDGPLQSADNTIYFNYKSYELSSDDSLILWSYVKALRADEGRYLKINSHTDQAEALGNWSFSALRSVAIVQYLEARGISLDRIYVQNWEDTKPVVPCPEGTPCSKEQREQNQRSELSIVGVEDWPTEPDHIITYGFNDWKLPEGEDKAVFGAIKLLKENPERTITLDGYADTWGTYVTNQRISQLRAENIKNIITANGIDDDRIEIIWHGESVPFGGCLLYYPCPVKERTQNRRVEIRLD